MKRLVLSAFLLLPIFFSLTSTAGASQPPEVLPEATAEWPGVGEPGPRLMAGERAYTTTEFIAVVVQDANIMWTGLFETWDRVFVPPTVVTIGEGAYARSSCGMNTGDPREDEKLVPALFCQYGGEVGTQLIDSSEVAETIYIYSPVIYLSAPWLEGYAAESGAEADVALAYRVMREYVHHVEYLLGYIDHTGGGAGDLDDAQVAVMSECFTGVWASSAYDRGYLDLDAIGSAQSAAWGEDAIPMRTFGREWVAVDSQQLLDAFTTGYETRSPAACLD